MKFLGLLLLAFVASAAGQGSTFITTITLGGSTVTATTSSAVTAVTVTASPATTTSAPPGTTVAPSETTITAPPTSTTSLAPTTSAPTTSAASPTASLTPASVYSCILSGSETVPPVDTPANGTAFLDFSQYDDFAVWNLTGKSISNPVAGLIQYGPSGIIGPIVLRLFSSSPGVFTDASVYTEGYAGDRELTNFINTSPVRNTTALRAAADEGLLYISVSSR
ncbi:hypothetical protein DFJ74DRAFT_758095 [Hyaloraphidium curvatum]|nr:hypothetical protein DFJ74DRAFT_758095 [Hyaloraphidium curvatum]